MVVVVVVVAAVVDDSLGQIFLVQQTTAWSQNHPNIQTLLTTKTANRTTIGDSGLLTLGKKSFCLD